LEALKHRYKKILLRKLIIEEDNGSEIVYIFKSVNMKVAVDLVAESWNEIELPTIHKSRRKRLGSGQTSDNLMDNDLNKYTEERES